MGDNGFALAIQGGGARGVFAAGILDELITEGLWADEVFGTSAGALYSLPYVSKVPEGCHALSHLFYDLKGFINVGNYFNNRPIFDYELLLDTLKVTKTIFNPATFYGSACKAYAAAVNVKTKQVAYFEKTDRHFEKGLAASASLAPYGKVVEIGEYGYMDGGYVCAIPFLRPLREGKKKIVVIATRERGYRKQEKDGGDYKKMEKLYSQYPEWLDLYKNEYANTYNEHMDLMDRMADEGRIFVFYPTTAPKVEASEQNKKKIEKLYNEGRKDAQEMMPALKEYLSK